MSSTTITMPSAIQGAIQAMCEDAIGQAVASLSTKYGFDVAEAQRELNLGKIQIKSGTTNASARKKSSDPEKPKSKRGPTGYLLYTKELRPKVKAELEAYGDQVGHKLKPQDIITALAARWKALDDDEKSTWNAKANNPISSDDKHAAVPDTPPPSPSNKETKKETKKDTKKDTNKDGKKDIAESSDAPKKRQSGYLLFGKEMRADIKKAMETDLEEGDKLKPAAIISEIAAQWKGLTEDEKAKWNDKANTPALSDAESD